jgi:hypothetical protein
VQTATRFALASALILATLATSAGATVVTLQPSSQDAFIQQDKPNRIAGAGVNNTRIRVMSSTPSPRIRRGLIQFDLSAIPASATISSAILEIYEANNPGVTRTDGLHRILAPWLQSAVKWNNQPASMVSPTDTAAVGTVRGFKSFTVTNDVQQAVNVCTADHGWMVKDQAETTGNIEVNYIAREENHIPDLPNRPRLTVTFTAPPCTTNADCADSNPCSTNERCVAGSCVVDPVNCDDGDPCTDDICDCLQGCLNPPICNDGFSCTTDTCDPNTLACTFTPNDAACNQECSTGTCVADEDATNLDPVTGCLPTPKPQGTACSPDGNPCTDDVCDGNGACGLDNNAPCDDGSVCTSNDQCSGGTCGGTSVVCTPLDQCHDAGVCDPMGGGCSNPPKTNGAGCDDGNACTQTDACDGAGTCVGGSSVVCTALDQCHDAGLCDPQTGLCSNPPSSSSTSCNDGNACTQTDTCDGAGTCVGGNPVVCTPSDDCHVAGTCDTGTGLCSNPAAGDGTTCDDGNTCTLSDTCSGGTCIGNPMTCGDGIVQPSCNEECDDSTPGANCTAQCRFICGPTPDAGCRQPAVANKAVLVLKNKSPDKKDALLWKYVKGAATALGDFGDPLNTTGYTLCVYDASVNPQPLILAMAPPGGTCAGKPCWKTIKNGYKYKDKELTPDGLQFILEKAGVATKTKLIVKGKGANLAMTTLPLTTPVTVQLKRSDTPTTCWQATYSTATKNLPEQFKAKAD